MKKISHLFYIQLVICIFTGCAEKRTTDDTFKTICNPINISYRFCLNEPSRREAADPSCVLFNDEYYLFASVSGGYFHSYDLITWDLIVTEDLPIEDYAPTAVEIDNELYFMTSANGSRSIYKTADPKSGRWQLVTDQLPFSATDPMLFLDDDGRVYYYFGCSDHLPIMAVELDRNNSLYPIGIPVECFNSQREKYGWEQPGDYNELDKSPWIEGAWMNKQNGKYYLQYSSPGTEYKSYADGVYLSDQPLGPFTLAKVNPFAAKVGGFVNGAGHGCTFEDRYGNFWHFGTATISVKHDFERRLSLFPVFFDTDDEMAAYTGFGDYPMIIPDKKVSDIKTLFPGWMLLSFNKKVEVSSVLENYPAQNAVNEDIRTYWSAKTGNKGEFISIDLEENCTINAVQINFAEQDGNIFGRQEGIYHQYLLEYSLNGKKWKTLIDKSNNTTDIPHDYVQLSTPVNARFVRLTNIKIPDGKFAISGLRIFGNSNKKPADATTNVNIERQSNDRRIVKISWDVCAGATGYNIRFGNQPDKLYQNYMVYGQNELVIRSLNTETPYFFAIDSFNEAGITEGKVSDIIL